MSHFLEVELELIPVICNDAWAKLQNNPISRKIECTIDSQNITDEMNNNNVSISDMYTILDETSAHTLSFTISCGRKPGSIKNSLDVCKNLLNLNPTKLRVSAKTNLDSDIEILDLLKNHIRLIDEVPTGQIEQTPGHRLDVDSRFRSIKLQLQNYLEGI